MIYTYTCLYRLYNIDYVYPPTVVLGGLCLRFDIQLQRGRQAYNYLSSAGLIFLWLLFHWVYVFTASQWITTSSEISFNKPVSLFAR